MTNAILLGFILGMRHATDADHVVAVTTIVARDRTLRQAGLIGAAWGVGHTATILIVGSLIIGLGWVIPHRLSLSMEFAVGVMLVALGVASLRPEKRRRVSFYANRKTTPGVVSRHARPLVVGLVHGLAGSAAVTLLMIAAVRDPVWAIAHLGVFGVGTIAGMALITMVMALPFTCAASRADRLGSALRIGAGLVSVVLGLLIAYDSGALFLTV